MPMIMPLTRPAWRGQQSTQQMSTESEAKHANNPQEDVTASSGSNQNGSA